MATRNDSSSRLSRRILLKPERFTPEERTIMMRHFEIDADILAQARSLVLRAAADVVPALVVVAGGTG